MQPKFIIADEPISALDVSIRAQVLNLMNRLKREMGLTYLFIAHDLSIVRFITDRVGVIHKGKIVELAETEELYNNPLHPYTRSLLSAIPMPNPQYEKSRKVEFYDPSQHNYDQSPPEWVEIRKGHYVLGNPEEIAGYEKQLQQAVEGV
jgi:oligopeptide transport system ATP-binding protein